MTGWRTYLTLGRVSNLPTVWTNVLAGTVLAGAAASILTLLLLATALSLFYVGGMFLNDAFDRQADALDRPDRPIPAGEVPARRVFVLGFGMLAGGLLLLVPASNPGTRTPTLLGGVGLVVVIITYDAWHKANPLSPLLMGVARALVYLVAGLAVVGGLPISLLAGSAVLTAYLIGLTYVARQEALGRVRNLWPLVFLAAPFLYAAPAIAATPGAAAMYAGFLAWVVYALTLLVRPPRKVPRAVVSLIAGIALLDALLIALHGAPVLAWAAVGGFAATLSLQKLVSGT